MALDSGIMTPLDRAAQMLQAAQLHLIKVAFFLELTTSARQKADMKFAQAFSRICAGAAAEEDALHLNQRHLDLDDISGASGEDQSRWRAAAILAAKSIVNALNRIGVIRGGLALGALIMRALCRACRHVGVVKAN